MKKRNVGMVGMVGMVVGLLVLGLLAAGCGSFSGAKAGQAGQAGTAVENALLVKRAVVSSVTNTVTTPVVSEQSLLEKHQTPEGQTVLTTNLVLVTNYVTEAKIVTVTNYISEVKPEIQAGLAMAQGATPFIPPPYSTAVEAGLTAIGGILALYAKKKNGEAQSATEQLTAVVQGVEAVTSALPGDQAAKVKATIQQVATLAGVQAELHATVQSATAG